jgi:hypothetical protein
VIFIFAEDHICYSYPVAVLEKSAALLAYDFRSVAQPKVLFGQRLDAQSFQNRRGHHRVDGAGVDQKLYCARDLWIARIPTSTSKDGQSQGASDSSVESGGLEGKLSSAIINTS